MKIDMSEIRQFQRITTRFSSFHYSRHCRKGKHRILFIFWWYSRSSISRFWSWRAII